MFACEDRVTTLWACAWRNTTPARARPSMIGVAPVVDP
jgi:hypothetical protein